MKRLARNIAQLLALWLILGAFLSAAALILLPNDDAKIEAVLHRSAT